MLKRNVVSYKFGVVNVIHLTGEVLLTPETNCRFSQYKSDRKNPDCFSDYN